MELWFLRFLNKSWVIWILETRLVSSILDLILRLMERNDPLPTNSETVKFIFLISYGATPQRLTHMSRNTTEMAKELARKFPKAIIIGCEFRDNTIDANEFGWKLEIFEHPDFIWGGRASSTTDERELLVKMAMKYSGNIDNSIIVGNGAHIRRASIVWGHYHPNSNLCFRSTNAKEDGDLENPLIAQRRWQVWVVANLVGLLFYKLLGVEYFAKKNLSQPTS